MNPTTVPYQGYTASAEPATVTYSQVAQSPTVVSNYNTQSKVNDINSQYQNHVNTQTPSFPTGTSRAVYAPSGDGSTGEFIGYAQTPEQEKQLLGSYQTQGQTSFGTNFKAPQEAQLQPNGTYLYQGNYYTKDQLSSPESLAAISNTSIQQKKYDEALQSELAAINKRYDMYRQQQEQVTSSGAAGAQNALLQSGAGGRGSVAQYAAVTADARVQSIMQDGQKALAELDSQRDQLLSAARVAYQDKNYQLLGNLNAQITKNRDQMISLAKEKNEAIATETKNAQKTSDIASIYEQGITDPAAILGKLKEAGITNISAKEVADTLKNLSPEGTEDLLKTLKLNSAPSGVVQKTIQAIATGGLAAGLKEAGVYAQGGGTGIIGEYNYYKAQAEAAGQNPVDFNTYQNMDANRKAKVAAASVAGSAGLTTTQANLATKLSDDYEQRSKDFYTIRDAYNKIVSAAKNPSAAGDMALLFGYMKLLDPNSVVRETEYATAQNAGSIPETIRARYNAAVNGKKLDEAQRKDFVDRSKKVFETSKQQQDVLKKDFESRAVKYGVPTDLVVRETEALSQELVTSEKEAADNLSAYITANPAKQSEIASKITLMEKQLGRHINAVEFYEAFPEYKK